MPGLRPACPAPYPSPSHASFPRKSPGSDSKDVSLPFTRGRGSMADRQSPTPAEITIMAAGAVMLIFSFLDFATKTSAWGSHLFPIATLLPLYGLVMAIHIALTKFASVKVPDSVLGFTWEQVHLALGAMA